MALHLWSVYSTGQTGQLWFCQPGSRAPTHLSHGCSPAYPHYDSITIHQKYPCVCCVRVFVFMYKKINASIDQFTLVITSSHRSLSLSVSFSVPYIQIYFELHEMKSCVTVLQLCFLPVFNQIKCDILGQLFNLGASRFIYFIFVVKHLSQYQSSLKLLYQSSYRNILLTLPLLRENRVQEQWGILSCLRALL